MTERNPQIEIDRSVLKNVDWEKYDAVVRSFRDIDCVSTLDVSPISQQETGAVANGCEKVSALCFDRVWGSQCPSEVRFFMGTEEEHEQLKFERLVESSFEPISNLVHSEDTYTLAAVLLTIMPRLAGKTASICKDGIPDPTIGRSLAITLANTLGREIPVVYRSEQTMQREYRQGHSPCIVATLSGLKIVDESTTSWEQVLQFRKDKEAVNKYRRFVHWLDGEMVGRPIDFIVDELNNRMEDYELSMKRHGLKTVLGFAKCLLDKDNVIASSVASAAGAVAGGEFVAGAAFVATLVGTASVNIAEQLIELQDYGKGKQAEVAYVIAAKNSFK